MRSKQIISTILLIVSTSPLAYATGDVNSWDNAVEGKTHFQYEHNFKTRDRRHGDSFKIVHQTKNEWSWELKYSTYGGSGKNYDKAFEDPVSGSAGVVIQNRVRISDGFSYRPSAEVDFSNNSLQYILGGSLSLPNIWDDFQTYVRYRYQYRKYNRTDRWATTKQYANGFDTSDGYNYVTYRKQGDVGTHRFEVGMTYTGFKQWPITFITLYDYADYTNYALNCNSKTCSENKYSMFNNKKGYWYNEIKIQYRGWAYFIPYIEVDQSQYSGSSIKEQAAIKTGFNYFF